jgi:predicted HicB family RNase H-like nuclease
VAALDPEASSRERDTDKQQFNVYLPSTLIRRAKHAAVDHASSLSKLVEVALTEHLDSLEEEAP